jgi:hypothetical protein
MFYKAKALTPVEIISAKSAQAEQARLSTRTHSAQAPESLTIKIKARWVGGGHKQSEMYKSTLSVSQANSSIDHLARDASKFQMSLLPTYRLAMSPPEVNLFTSV